MTGSGPEQSLKISVEEANDDKKPKKILSPKMSKLKNMFDSPSSSPVDQNFTEMSSRKELGKVLGKEEKGKLAEKKEEVLLEGQDGENGKKSSESSKKKDEFSDANVNEKHNEKYIENESLIEKDGENSLDSAKENLQYNNDVESIKPSEDGDFGSDRESFGSAHGSSEEDNSSVLSAEKSKEAEEKEQSKVVESEAAELSFARGYGSDEADKEEAREEREEKEVEKEEKEEKEKKEEKQEPKQEKKMLQNPIITNLKSEFIPQSSPDTDSDFDFDFVPIKRHQQLIQESKEKPESPVDEWDFSNHVVETPSVIGNDEKWAPNQNLTPNTQNEEFKSPGVNSINKASPSVQSFNFVSKFANSPINSIASEDPSFVWREQESILSGVGEKNELGDSVEEYDSTESQLPNVLPDEENVSSPQDVEKTTSPKSEDKINKLTPGKVSESQKSQTNEITEPIDFSQSMKFDVSQEKKAPEEDSNTIPGPTQEVGLGLNIKPSSTPKASKKKPPPNSPESEQEEKTILRPLITSKQEQNESMLSPSVISPSMVSPQSNFRIKSLNSISQTLTNRRPVDPSKDPNFRPFMKSGSPIISIYSPPVGGPHKRIDAKPSPLFGQSPQSEKSPTFSTMSSPISDTNRDTQVSPNTNPYNQFSPFVNNGSLAESPKLIQSQVVGYEPSIYSSTGPMSPKTREKVTTEVKEMFANRGSKPIVSSDMYLPSQPLNKDRFPNTLKFDPTKSMVFAVCLCDFNHLRGPEIEYWIDENGSIDIEKSPEAIEKLSNMWPILPFQALPDGSHDFEETFSYFNVLYDTKTKKTLNSICDVSEYEALKDFDAENEETSLTKIDRCLRKGEKISDIQNSLIDFNENVTTLWAISCVRQISADDLSIKSPNVTRSSVQKSIVILCRQPIFGQLKEKLSIITKSFFMQKDFTDKSLLNILFDNLCNLYAPDLKLIEEQKKALLVQSPSNVNEGINSTLKENDFYVGLSLKELVHHFKRNVLIIFKAMLLEKRILFFSKNIEKLCSAQLSIISLIPNLITNLDDCGSPYLNFVELNASKSLNLKTSNRYSLLRFLGLPLQPFGLAGIFNPYTPLQQLDDIKSNDKITHYVIGSSNDLLLDQKEKYADLVVNLDSSYVDIINHDLDSALYLSGPDKKFVDLLIKNVEQFYFNGESGSNGLSLEDETNFYGSEDYIRMLFEDYLLGLLSSIKYDKFLNKLGVKVTFENEFTSPQRQRVISQSMLVPDVDIYNIDRFNIEFIKSWLQTENYKAFDRLTDNEIFYIFDPQHVVFTENFINQKEEFDKNYNKNNFIEGLNMLRQNVQSRLQKVPLTSRASLGSFSGSDSALQGAFQQHSNASDAGSIHSHGSVDKSMMKYASMESGSFSLDDLSTLNSINAEIEMTNPIAKQRLNKEAEPPKGSWSIWGWGKK